MYVLKSSFCENRNRQKDNNLELLQELSASTSVSWLVQIYVTCEFSRNTSYGWKQDMDHTFNNQDCAV